MGKGGDLRRSFRLEFTSYALVIDICDSCVMSFQRYITITSTRENVQPCQLIPCAL